MNAKRIFILTMLGLALRVQPAHAQSLVPGDGSDGVLAPDGSVTNVVIDLSKAVTGAWDTNNTKHAGQGVFDPELWAVVFKYAYVHIPAGVTVSFKNHPSHAPVVWLVSENVTNLGTIDLSGHPGQSGPLGVIPAEPGPGGFRGGPIGPLGCGAGLGPGGGNRGVHATYEGSYASFGRDWAVGPLIGGSGGAAGDGIAGGGGGGAILMFVESEFANDGAILAKGGGNGLTGGSGGAVVIMPRSFSGTGEINCSGGGAKADVGRIRIFASDRGDVSPSFRTYPETVAEPRALGFGVWPPDCFPSVRILEVDEASTSDAPTAPLTGTADVAIANEGQAIITIETKDFPLGGTLEVRAASKWGGAAWVPAWYQDGKQALAHWRAYYRFPKGYTTLQVRATAP